MMRQFYRSLSTGDLITVILYSVSLLSASWDCLTSFRAYRKHLNLVGWWFWVYVCVSHYKRNIWCWHKYGWSLLLLLCLCKLYLRRPGRDLMKNYNLSKTIDVSHHWNSGFVSLYLLPSLPYMTQEAGVCVSCHWYTACPSLAGIKGKLRI